MARVSKTVSMQRPDEIIAACRKLYETMSFKEITLSDISRETSFSRPSIYNYFQTKEEIFLAIMEQEHRLWADDLRSMIANSSSMTADSFARQLSASVARREVLLKILCMNLYDIEEHSRLERLVSFKKQYFISVGLLKEAAAKFFPSLSLKEQDSFVLSFLLCMSGVYPYSHPTDKQSQAMKIAGVSPLGGTVQSLMEECIRNLLQGASAVITS